MRLFSDVSRGAAMVAAALLPAPAAARASHGLPPLNLRGGCASVPAEAGAMFLAAVALLRRRKGAR